MVNRFTQTAERVLAPKPQKVRESGALMTEMVIAMAILVIAVMPLGYSFVHDQKLLRTYYDRAVAMEIVDGEMEALTAGEWRSFSEGTHDYTVHANSLTNLAAGKFLLTVSSNRLRLEWTPGERDRGGRVVREAVVK